MDRKQIVLVEIIFWLLIIFCGSFFFIYKTTIKDNINNTYYIFFDDVEGLVKGSPVRLMGINIGYIKDVKIFDNKVFVSILVTKKDTIIPKSATATIEFYGISGSTSLELNPSTATETENTDEIIPSNSYRVQDFWDGSKLTAEVMIDIYGSIGRTIKSAGLIEKKDLLKQSNLVNTLALQTDKVNRSQTVIINKMSENTKKYLEQKENNNHNKEGITNE